MKIAITGATGFIGRQVVKYLLDYSTCQLILLYRNNVPEWKDDRIHAISLDIYDCPELVYNYIETPDVLLHLAWEDLNQYKSLRHLDTILPAHMHFLKQLVEQGLPRLVVAGTCFEYGLQEGLCKEESKVAPVMAYPMAKLALLNYVQQLTSTHSTSYTWLRYFYMYGDSPGKKTLFSMLKEAIQSGSSHFNMSSGEQLRDYLAIEDIATYTSKVLLNQNAEGIINIACGKPVSVRSMVERFIRENFPHTTIQLNLGYYSLPDYEPIAFWGDTTKLNKYIQK